jgi:hypothetical protein
VAAGVGPAIQANSEMRFVNWASYDGGSGAMEWGFARDGIPRLMQKSGRGSAAALRRSNFQVDHSLALVYDDTA